ncbi:hypothetical protein LTR37_006056 [Vermiconidia calcicola]|uniref:Uncharacterized protein n=1 Tax=Vermiconidia calcicola TaxID=1690605 RepID=A0ACC3NIQ0_9PEZI|nr:hypothetical protein LTR37_006056 [Vermiconidia calcicola]
MTSLQNPAVFCGGQLPRRDSPQTLKEERRDMLNKLKHQFSRKERSSTEANRTSSMKTEQNSHPQQSVSQGTRRPANPPTSMNPFRSTGEVPPPYSPAPQISPAVQPPAVTVTPASPSAVQDDAYAFLSSFDTVFLIDDSGSMAGARWRETRDALATITPICTAHDADGIDIFFLNSADSPKNHNVTRTDTVSSIFERVKPGGGTPTGQRLNQIIKPYLRRYEANPDGTKPINIICITDGAPSDDVESPLIAAAKKLDKLDAPAWQVGVQFFQVGRDEEAKRHLKQLDDELAEISGDDELRDIVDTVPFKGAEGGALSGEGIMKVVLGSVHRKLDRKKSKDLHR